MWRTFIVLLLSLVSPLALAFSYTVEMTEQELQQRLSALMPLERKELFVTVVVSQPQVDLAVGNNQLGIFAHIEVSTPSGMGAGKVKIQGRLSYQAKEAAFYLSNPKLVRLDIENVPQEFLPAIREISQLAISHLLETQPVYVLRNDNLRHRLLKSSLKSVSIKDRRLLVELNAP